jgi:uncharacterized membrane protein YhaH (DUF805 family)
MLEKWLHFYFSFKGRATRRDFNVLYAVVALIGYIVAGILDVSVSSGNLMEASQRDPFSTFWNLVVIVPTFALTCKRLHDMGYSGWWQLLIYCASGIVFFIVVGSAGIAFLLNPAAGTVGGLLALILVLVAYLAFFILLSVKRGTVGPNKYGPDPLALEVVQ